ncbi:MAG: hypothetical protein QNK03_11465 [Myxococcota bacterium]|nr:hypothetical protein [Myxococcota bacterium]
MNDLRSLVLRGLAAPPLPALARRGYRATARLLAHRLRRIPGADTVFLSGSAARPAGVRPGSSDLDLVVLCRLADAQDELTLLRRLDRLQTRAQALTRLVDHLAYLEVEDLALLRRYGSSSYLRVARRWERLEGAHQLGADPPRPDRALQQLSRLLFRWALTAPELLARAEGAGFGELQRAQRLLVDVVAARDDLDRHAPFEELLERAPIPAEDRARQPVLALLQATLELLDRMAARETSDWCDRFVTSGHPQRAALPDDAAAVARRWLSVGFETIVWTGLGPGNRDRVLLALAPAADVRDAIEMAQRAASTTPRLSGEFSRVLPRPVPLTASLWRAVALLPPVPFLGAALAGEEPCFEGLPPAAPPAPGPDLRRTLVDAQVAEAIGRLRLRRIGRPRAVAFRASQDEQFRRNVPALARCQDEGVIPLEAVPGALGPPRLDLASIREVRAWIDVRRAAFADPSRP